MIQIPTTSTADPQLIVVGASGLAVWLQAGATLALVVLTGVYVWLTRALVRRATAQVDNALRIHNETERQRQNRALKAIRFEIATIQNACKVVNQEFHTRELATASWDSGGGDMPRLDDDTVADLIEFYSWVRRCNGLFYLMVHASSKDERMHRSGMWGKAITRLPDLAQKLLQALPDA